jgi:hypothetical protein
MKRIISIAPVLILALCLLTACGVSGGAPAQGGGNGGSGGDSGLTQREIDDADAALDQLEEWAKAQGWSENSYGNWIAGVWDSEVLPDCVPNEIPGVKVDQTTYKEKRHDTLSGSYGVGSLYFADSQYEAWGLMFYCTDDQLTAFTDGMQNAGFYGGMTDDYPYPEYEWLGNGYYAHMRVNADILGEEEYDNLAMFDIAPADTNPRPVAFQGMKLPDFGAVKYDCREGVGYGYDGEEEKENFYDVFADKGELPSEGWNFWLDYFGATPEQAKSYAQYMSSQGWTIEYENEEDGRYSCSLKKGENLVGGVEFTEYDYTVKVGFANMGENLWY